MNLSEFRALIAEYALEHPERPLSDVSMVEFAAWRDIRAGTEAQSIAEGRRAGKMSSFAPAPWEYAPDLIIQDEVQSMAEGRRAGNVCGKVKANFSPDTEYGPPYFNADGTNTLEGLARIAARDRYRARARAIREAMNANLDEAQSEEPDLIIQDEVSELKTTRSVAKMRDYAERHGYTAKQVTYVTPSYWHCYVCGVARGLQVREAPGHDVDDANGRRWYCSAKCFGLVETRDRPVVSEGFAEASPINEPQCDECGGPLPADAIADGSRLCSPECVDDHYPEAIE